MSGKSMKPKFGFQAGTKKEGSTNLLKVVGLVLETALAVVLVVLAVSMVSSKIRFNRVHSIEKVGVSVDVASADNASSSKLVLQNNGDFTDEIDNLYEDLKELFESEKYTDVIEKILNLSMSTVKNPDDIKALLEASINEEELVALDKMYTYLANNQYDEALNYINEKITYFDAVKMHQIAENYVTTDDFIAKREEIANSKKNYYYELAKECANACDENGMNDALNHLTEFFTYEEFEDFKKNVNTDFVLRSISTLPSKGYTTIQIISFINSHLASTGNNVWVIEFCDFYDSVYRSQTGDLGYDSKISHISSKGYIMDKSQDSYITYDDLRKLSRYESHMVIFEILARHGRVFADEAVNRYFNQRSWYKGTDGPETFDENCLNEYEQANIDTVIEYEKAVGYR